MSNMIINEYVEFIPGYSRKQVSNNFAIEFSETSGNYFPMQKHNNEWFYFRKGNKQEYRKTEKGAMKFIAEYRTRIGDVDVETPEVETVVEPVSSTGYYNNYVEDEEEETSAYGDDTYVFATHEQDEEQVSEMPEVEAVEQIEEGETANLATEESGIVSTPMQPKPYILRESLSPAKTGPRTYFHAYTADGTPLYMGDASLDALEKRLRAYTLVSDITVAYLSTEPSDEPVDASVEQERIRLENVLSEASHDADYPAWIEATEAMRALDDLHPTRGPLPVWMYSEIEQEQEQVEQEVYTLSSAPMQQQREQDVPIIETVRAMQQEHRFSGKPAQDILMLLTQEYEDEGPHNDGLLFSYIREALTALNEVWQRVKPEQ